MTFVEETALKFILEQLILIKELLMWFLVLGVIGIGLKIRQLYKEDKLFG